MPPAFIIGLKRICCCRRNNDTCSRYLNTFNNRPVTNRKANPVAKATVRQVHRQSRHGEYTAADHAADADGGRFPVADLFWFSLTHYATHVVD